MKAKYSGKLRDGRIRRGGGGWGKKEKEKKENLKPTVLLGLPSYMRQ